MEGGQKKKRRKEYKGRKGEKKRERGRKKGEPTWDPCHSSVQAGSSSSDLVGPSFSQGPHSELEGAPGDVLAPIFHVNSVSSHLLRDEADAVGAVLSFNDLCVLRLSSRTRHLSRHLLGTCLTWEGGGGGRGRWRDRRTWVRWFDLLDSAEGYEWLHASRSRGSCSLL